MKHLSEEQIIENYRKRIRHNFSSRFYNNANRVVEFLRMPSWFFDDIIVEGVENVKKVDGEQLVYISNHVSLADFLVQGHVFWGYDLPIPRFLAGENLNRVFLGRFFRKCGAIFIDREEREKLYWKIEDEEIKKVLCDGENLLVYPEGTRTDELSRLKTGTLGQLTDFVDNEGKDIYILPIKSSYDNRVEEGIIDRVRENKKKRDELKKRAKDFREQGKNLRARVIDWRAVMRDKLYFNLDFSAYIVRPFSKNKGNAYLKFGKAFSLKNALLDFEKQKKFILADIISEELEKL